ncbi:dehydrogenase/reductase SDR family member 9-like [Mya arenaria]|uniref:dehydrogenase/reductase SDR family member 9-like n=1 Tax=Mya arenaria TaxID=6604 RepID=UPI0022E6C043|nr:dehydrogenase/reductase SDR family member 9-like [Mya arenaria]
MGKLLKSDGMNHIDATMKAEILNKHFSSVFIHEGDTPLPELGESPYPDAPYVQNGVEELSSTCSKNVTPIRMDVTNDDSIKRAVEEITNLLPDKKGLWTVVNNAGVLGTTSGPTFWATRADYDNVLAVNLYGVVLVTNAFMPLIMKEKGRVVNTSSIAGRFAFGNAPYAVSKHGVEAFSDNLRRDVYKTGVTVHMLEPGFHKTPLLSVEAQKKRTEQKLKTLPDVWKKDLPSDIADISTPWTFLCRR